METVQLSTLDVLRTTHTRRSVKRPTIGGPALLHGDYNLLFVYTTPHRLAGAWEALRRARKQPRAARNMVSRGRRVFEVRLERERERVIWFRSLIEIYYYRRIYSFRFNLRRHV